MVHPGAVTELHLQRSGVILVNREVDLLFGNDLPSLLQGQCQSCCGVSPAPVLLADPIADVARTLPQGVVQAVAQVHQAHIVPVIVLQHIDRVRHIALRQALPLGPALPALDIGPKLLSSKTAGRVDKPVLLWEKAHLQIIGAFLIRLP